MGPALRRRLALLATAAVLAAVAVATIVAEPFPKGPVLLSITREHGVDLGDLPAVLALLAAGWLVRHP
jgi:hypothetical protein